MKITHVSAVCRSVENADIFYNKLLRFVKVKDFFIEAELTDKIFGTACRCRIVAYALDGQEVEVFIPDIFHEERNPFNHVCLEVDDRKSLVAACEDAGVSINKISRGDKLLIFINDFDGNMFEIKERVRS